MKTYYLTTPIIDEPHEFRSSLEIVARTCHNQQNIKEYVVRGYHDSNIVIVATFMCQFDAEAYIETVKELIN